MIKILAVLILRTEIYARGIHINSQIKCFVIIFFSELKVNSLYFYRKSVSNMSKVDISFNLPSLNYEPQTKIVFRPFLSQ